MVAIKEIQISALTVNCSQLLIVVSSCTPRAHVSACLHVYMFTVQSAKRTWVHCWTQRVFLRQLTDPRPDLESLFGPLNIACRCRAVFSFLSSQRLSGPPALLSHPTRPLLNTHKSPRSHQEVLVQVKPVRFLCLGHNPRKFFPFRSADGCFCPAHYSQCDTGLQSHSLGSADLSH